MKRHLPEGPSTHSVHECARSYILITTRLRDGPKQSKCNRGFYRTPLTSGEGEIATAAEKNTQAQRQQPEGAGFRDRSGLDNL